MTDIKRLQAYHADSLVQLSDKKMEELIDSLINHRTTFLTVKRIQFKASSLTCHRLLGL